MELKTNSTNSSFMVQLSKSVEYSSRFIYKNISDINIIEYYLGESISPNKLTLCRFHKDTNPSMGFYKTRFGNIRFNCFSCGINGGAIDFVSQIKEISFKEAVKVIIDDIYINPSSPIKLNKCNPVIFGNKERTEIYIEYRTFEVYDRIYWDKFGISLEDLLFFNIKPAHRVYYKKKLDKQYKHWATNSKYSPIYIYQYGSGAKVYRPMQEPGDRKWFQNTNKNDLQGLESLNNSSDILFITSSLKDAVILYKMGYAAIAPNSESNILEDSIINEFQERFRVVLFYDSDEPGYNYTLKQYRKYKKNNSDKNLEFIFIPRYYPEKDISDFVKSYGIEAGKRLVGKRLLWKNKKEN